MKEKTGLIILILFINFSFSYGQIESGEYDNGLKLAYNPLTGLVSGYYENYSGYDENTGNPMFSCAFYIHGLMKGNEIIIKTYDPLNKGIDIINGKLKRIEKNEISIKLEDQHGGCWNVWNFTEDFTSFKLMKAMNWIEIRDIEIEKAFFYTEKLEETKRKAFVLKGDIVFIEKIEKDWIYCSFHGKTVTKGWLKSNSINQN